LRASHAPPAAGARSRKAAAVDVADGELVRINPDLSVTGAPASDPLNFYRMLLYIGRERGRKDGWAWHQTREKFGIKPVFYSLIF